MALTITERRRETDRKIHAQWAAAPTFKSYTRDCSSQRAQ
eukprot:CAMPEP_0177619370 /NCGR_PEP_ID=MMETSP0419_2-20121207/26211_1 /TAXON_ID=582737 /ORGANISM="Tetraselmis sp., Strain GSL018" /LENGTH=39 /DNA_ID= /DNA_START= /DNA_END= /DNA_ORIENTATION=